jgi:acetyl-CoA carboxylase biotin carboxylase subunit
LGDFLPESPAVTGHAIEARVYAEDPVRFLPSPGRLTTFRPPAAPGLRVDTGYAEGGEVTSHYDPLLAKVIAHGQDREAAMELLAAGLRDFAVEGVKVNIPALLQIVASAPFRAGEVHTGLIAEVMAAASA